MKSSVPFISALGLTLVGALVVAQNADKATPSTELVSSKSDTSRATGTPRPWAATSSDIAQDSAVTYGTLDNGMRYIIQRSPLPAERVSMRLHVDAGSLDETEQQRGLAHFLEHMVFNGTRHFPDATKLVPQMQRLGIAFGAHANAYTSFDETVYMLDLPNIEESTLDLGFAVMSDFADGALLEEKEIQEERGVISSEKTTRDSVGLRMFQRQFETLFPNSMIGKRLPIGTEEVIQNAQRDLFVDFYTKFYAPEKLTFIYVGDLDVAEAQRRIKAAFGNMQNPAKKAPKGDVGDVTTKPGFQVHVFNDKELPATELTLLRSRSFEHKVDSKAQRLESLKLHLAHSIINRRLARIAKEDDTSILSGGASRSIYFRGLELGSIDVTPLENDWIAALPVLENEFRRALLYGFTSSEFNEAVADILNYYEQAVKSAPTRKSNDIASSLARHIHRDEIYSTPEMDLSIVQEQLQSLDPTSIHQSFTSFWNTEDISLILTTQASGTDTAGTLKALYLKEKQSQIDAPEERETQAFAYASDASHSQATVENQQHIQDLDIYQWQYGNGVAVNFKQTDFDKNSVGISISFGDGLASMPLEHPGLNALASAVFTAGGLGQHSSDDLRTILAGRNVGATFTIGEGSFNLSGSTTPEDLTLQLELLKAYLTDPGFRPEAERQYKSSLPQQYAQLRHTESGAMRQLQSWLSGGDPRFAYPSLTEAQALHSEQAKAWLSPFLDGAPLEISIVGDCSLEDAQTALSRTFAQLPERGTSTEVPLAERTLTFPDTPSQQAFTYESDIEKAMSVVLWKAGDNTERDIKRLRRLSVLSAILRDRMRIKLREGLGEAYSPFSYAQLSNTFKNSGTISAISPGKPAHTEKINKIISELAQELANNGSNEDELQRVIQPRLGILKKSLRQNSYWLATVMNQSQRYPVLIEAARDRDTDYASISVSDINELAKEILQKDNSAQISISPKKAE
ncbi:M16 family metallopeptidase [Rubritalea marina]|uniref:M16 family metallopeptidase n=1 Tax=Rubritalea marina TaxID=361055 RepID=UPI0012EAAD5A|nr:M16 family metallopeptidase [Rubritalea marina]